MKITAIGTSRRNFVKLATLGAGVLPLMGYGNPFNLTKEKKQSGLKVHLFSKHLQFLNYTGMSEAAAEMGFDGLDLTVRPKGHVLPSKVKEDFPKAVEAMQKYGLSTDLMTTNVTDANNVEQKNVLETASNLGVLYYRMGWLKYPEERTISESMEIYAKQFTQLESLNKELGLHGGYQNHAGNHVGAAVWDLHPLLKGKNPDYLGCQYDIRHATVEGGNSWELGLRRIHPFINTLVIKDFKWGMVNGKWKPVNVPLGEGMVDFKRFFSLLKTYKINVPVSLHLEYDLGGAEKGASTLTMKRSEVFGKMKKDLDYLRKTWEATA